MRGFSFSLSGTALAFVVAITLASGDRVLAAEGSPLPRTEAGARLQDFLDTFGKADTAGVRAFVERDYADDYKTAVPIENRIQLFLDARSRGALEAVDVLANEGAVVRVRARHALTREWRTIELTMDAGPKGRIKRISVS